MLFDPLYDVNKCPVEARAKPKFNSTKHNNKTSIIDNQRRNDQDDSQKKSCSYAPNKDGKGGKRKSSGCKNKLRFTLVTKEKLRQQGAVAALNELDGRISEINKREQVTKTAAQKLRILDKIRRDVLLGKIGNREENASENVSNNGSNSPDRSKNVDRSSASEKSRYVLFVGRLPPNTNEEEIARHFSQVGTIVDVRIPVAKQTNIKRNFAYIEFANNNAYEKAITLNHTMFKNKRINVEYTTSNRKDKKALQDVKAKNLKLQAMSNQGAFGGNRKKNQKRRERRAKAMKNKDQDPRTL